MEDKKTHVIPESRTAQRHSLSLRFRHSFTFSSSVTSLTGLLREKTSSEKRPRAQSARVISAPSSSEAATGSQTPPLFTKFIESKLEGLILITTSFLNGLRARLQSILSKRELADIENALQMVSLHTNILTKNPSIQNMRFLKGSIGLLADKLYTLSDRVMKGQGDTSPSLFAKTFSKALSPMQEPSSPEHSPRAQQFSFEVKMNELLQNNIKAPLCTESSSGTMGMRASSSS